MPRVSDDVLEEIIENDGCRHGQLKPIHPTGIVRLCLDLQEARKELERLKEFLNQAWMAGRALEAMTSQALKPDQDRANKSTRLDRGKRTKSKKEKRT